MFREYSINGQEPKTYTEYIRNSNVGLYNVLINCDAIQKETERQQEITRIINFIVEDIYVYLDKDEFKYVFNSIPTVSLDYIRKYIWNILNFFKSYKVDVIHANIIYKFDDRLHNKVRVLDKLLFYYIFTKPDKVNMSDCAKFLNNIQYCDNIDIIERLYLYVTYWKEKHFYDYVWVTDKDAWRSIQINYHWHDHIRVFDAITSFKYVFNWSDVVSPIDCMKQNVVKNPRTDVYIEDVIYFKRWNKPDPIT